MQHGRPRGTPFTRLLTQLEQGYGKGRRDCVDGDGAGRQRERIALLCETLREETAKHGDPRTATPRFEPLAGEPRIHEARAASFRLLDAMGEPMLQPSAYGAHAAMACAVYGDVAASAMAPLLGSSKRTINRWKDRLREVGSTPNPTSGPPPPPSLAASSGGQAAAGSQQPADAPPNALYLLADTSATHARSKIKIYCTGCAGCAAIDCGVCEPCRSRLRGEEPAHLGGRHHMRCERRRCLTVSGGADPPPSRGGPSPPPPPDPSGRASPAPPHQEHGAGSSAKRGRGNPAPKPAPPPPEGRQRGNAKAATAQSAPREHKARAKSRSEPKARPKSGTKRAREETPTRRVKPRRRPDPGDGGPRPQKEPRAEEREATPNLGAARPPRHARRPPPGQCGSLYRIETALPGQRQLLPPPCTRQPNCLGCAHLLYAGQGKRTPPVALAFAQLGGRSGGIPPEVARLAMAVPCSTATIDERGTCLIMGPPKPALDLELELQNALLTPQRRVPRVRRGELIGLYVADTLRSGAVHMRRLARGPLSCSYSAAIGSCVLDSANHATGTALANEGGWVNAFLMPFLLSNRGEAPDLTLLGLFGAEDIHDGAEVRTHYGAAYEQVRNAKKYQAARDPEGPCDFTPEEEAALPDTVLSTYDDAQLTTLAHWGGVWDEETVHRKSQSRSRGAASPLAETTFARITSESSVGEPRAAAIESRRIRRTRRADRTQAEQSSHAGDEGGPPPAPATAATLGDSPASAPPPSPSPSPPPPELRGGAPPRPPALDFAGQDLRDLMHCIRHSLQIGLTRPFAATIHEANARLDVTPQGTLVDQATALVQRLRLATAREDGGCSPQTIGRVITAYQGVGRDTGAGIGMGAIAKAATNPNVARSRTAWAAEPRKDGAKACHDEAAPRFILGSPAPLPPAPPTPPRPPPPAPPRPAPAATAPTAEMPDDTPPSDPPRRVEVGLEHAEGGYIAARLALAGAPHQPTPPIPRDNATPPPPPRARVLTPIETGRGSTFCCVASSGPSPHVFLCNICMFAEDTTGAHDQRDARCPACGGPAAAAAQKARGAPVSCKRGTPFGNCFTGAGPQLTEAERNSVCDLHAELLAIIRAGVLPSLSELAHMATGRGVRVAPSTPDAYSANLAAALQQHQGTRPNLVCAPSCMRGMRCHRSGLQKELELLGTAASDGPDTQAAPMRDRGQSHAGGAAAPPRLGPGQLEHQASARPKGGDAQAGALSTTAPSGAKSAVSRGLLGFFREDEHPYGPLSNWHVGPIADGEHSYDCAEALLMARKAALFEDSRTLAKIRKGGHSPQQYKMLGRQVSDFDEDTWAACREDIADDVIALKFDQSAELAALLESTGTTTLVEASPTDAVWGAGLDWGSIKSGRPWTGLNLLGSALERQRERARLHPPFSQEELRQVTRRWPAAPQHVRARQDNKPHACKLCLLPLCEGECPSCPPARQPAAPRQQLTTASDAGGTCLLCATPCPLSPRLLCAACDGHKGGGSNPPPPRALPGPPAGAPRGILETAHGGSRDEVAGGGPATGANAAADQKRARPEAETAEQRAAQARRTRFKPAEGDPLPPLPLHSPGPQGARRTQPSGGATIVKPPRQAILRRISHTPVGPVRDGLIKLLEDRPGAKPPPRTSPLAQAPAQEAAPEREAAGSLLELAAARPADAPPPHAAGSRASGAGGGPPPAAPSSQEGDPSGRHDGRTPEPAALADVADGEEALAQQEERDREWMETELARGGDNALLHLFAGPHRVDGLGAAAAQLGCNVVELDCDERDARHNLAKAGAQRAVLDAVHHRRFAGILLGIPCTPYSILHGQTEAWVTKEYPEGRPDLSTQAKAWLRVQQQLLLFATQVIDAAIKAGTSIILENPAPRDDKSLRSYWEGHGNTMDLWHTQPVIAMRERHGARLRLIVVPQCAFGRGPHGYLFQKYTGLLCTAEAAAYIEGLRLWCNHKAGAHDKVQGTNAAGVKYSKLAAAYPGPMYTTLAIALLHHLLSDDDLSAADAASRAARPHDCTRPEIATASPSPGCSTDAGTPDEPPPAGAQGDAQPSEPTPPAAKEDAAPQEPPGQPPPLPPAPEHAPASSQAQGTPPLPEPSLPRPLEPVEQARGVTVPAAAQHQGGQGELPILDTSGAAGVTADSILLLPVRTSAITGAEPLALLPLHRGVFGFAEAAHARNHRREAAAEAAAKVAAPMGVHKDACFLAGEVDLQDQGFEEACGVRASVVVAPCAAGTMPADAARDAPSLAALRRASAGHAAGQGARVWASLAALAGDSASPDGKARYRAAAVAIAMAEAHVQPTSEGPTFSRSGARARGQAQAPTSKCQPGAIPLSTRMKRADAAADELHAALLAVDAEAEPTLAEFCHGLAGRVHGCGTGQVPEELYGMQLPEPPHDLLQRAFKHNAQVLRTSPKPAPAPQQPPPDGWWPHDIHDIVEPWCLERIRDWLRRCALWHQGGGGALSRPAPEAYGEEALRPQARGRRWDLRGGPGNIKLWREYTAEERQARTCVKLAFAKELFSDCIDEEFVEFLLAGVRFHADLQPQIVLMPNLLSLYQDGGISAAAAQADDMVKAGFIAVFDDLPSIPFRVIPRGVVPKQGTDELRGIADQGAPRKPLLVLPKSAQGGGDDTYVEALNDKCRAGEWLHEDKDGLEHAAFNGSILQAIADVTGEVVLEAALDMSKWFHRMFYEAMELWTTGALIPSKTSGVLRLAIEMALTMGATPASQIAQRFANAMVQQVCRRMDELEAEARARTPLAPEVQAILHDRTAHIPADSYSVQGRLYDLTFYTDDGHAMVVGAARMVRFLRAFWAIAGPEGLDTPLSRASKQQIGVCVTWVGGGLAAGLGLVWVPRAKVTRAVEGLATTLANRMEVGEYRRVAGFLVSILFMLGNDATLLSHIFRPMKPGNELDSGPHTTVFCDELMAGTLCRWQRLILNTPGAPALCAAAPAPPAASAPRYRIRTDAALQGTPSPGLGGCMYGLWWAIAIADWPGLETLDIPHLELLAACVGLLTYAEMLSEAEHIELDTDALATAVALTKRAKSPELQAILDVLLLRPEYQAIAKRLGVSQLFGAANIMSDAASRGYAETLRAVAESLGIKTKRIEISAAARSFLADAVSALTKLRSRRSWGATSRGTHNLNLDGNMPIAHGGARGGPAPEDDAPPPRPPRRPQPQGAMASHSWAAAAPAAWRAARAPPPRQPARSPPSTWQSPQPHGKLRRTWAQVASPRCRISPIPPPPPALSQRRPPSRSIETELAAADPWTPAPPPARLTAPAQRQPDEAAPPRPPTAGPSVAQALRQPERARRPPSELDIARQQLRASLVARLANDTSEHALRCDHTFLEWMCEVAQGDPEDTPVTTQANLRSNWRHWERFCAEAGAGNPWRPNIETLDPSGVERERVLWTAGLIWIYTHSMKPKPGNLLTHGEFRGQPAPCKPENALAILRGVRKEHLDRGLTPPTLTLATRRMHELTRRYAKLYGPENLVPKKKSTLTHALIVGMLNVKEDSHVPHRVPRASRRATDTDDAGAGRRTPGKLWSWRTPFGASCAALFHVLSQTGFRKAEVALGDEEWGNMHISFANLTWRIGGVDTPNPTAAQLFNLKKGDFAIIRPPPSKCDPYSAKWGNSPIYLPFCGDASLNAARALGRWELAARVTAAERHNTPLFCGPGGTGTPLTQDVCDDVLESLLTLTTGSKDVARKYSIHSFRSYVASSMLAAKCTDAQIQAALRWSSAEALQEYKNITPEAYGSWLLGAERVKLTNVMRARDLARLPRTDDLDHMNAIHSARAQCRRDAEQADQDKGASSMIEELQGRAERPSVEAILAQRRAMSHAATIRARATRDA